MTDGIRGGGFAAANQIEQQRQAELQRKLNEQAAAARHFGEPELAKTVQNERKALGDDKAVSSTALQDMGAQAGWNEKRMADALARHDRDNDGTFSEDEFDMLAAEMEPGDAQGYTVKSGDSLSAITKASGRDPGAWKELYEANKDVVGDNPNLIQPGQELKKPPGWVIEDAKITPEKPTHEVPDRQAELQKQAQLADTETLGQAEQALAQIPQDSPKRAQYEQQVKALQEAYDQKWPKPEPKTETPPEAPPETKPDTPTETDPVGGGGPTEEQPPEAPVDAQAKADYEKMMQDPQAARGWDAARKGKVQEYAESQVEAQLKTAADPAKTPQERLAAAEAAEQIAKDTITKAEQAGYGDIAQGLVDQGAKAEQAVQDLKLATGDQKVVEDAIKAAGTDPAKLQAIADQLPQDDPRAKALSMIAAGQVSDGVRDKLLDALKDQDSTRGDFAEALQRCGGNANDLAAIGAVADYKAAIQPAETKAELEAFAASVHAIEKASDGVRRELVKGFDDRGNRGDYERAVEQATSKEDLAALKAFADHKAQTEGTDGPTFGGNNPSARLQAAVEGYEALRKSGDWKQVQNLLRDNTDNKQDLVRAGIAASDPATLAALAKLAESVGENGVAVGLRELTLPQFKDAPAGTRKALLER